MNRIVEVVEEIVQSNIDGLVSVNPRRLITAAAILGIIEVESSRLWLWSLGFLRSAEFGVRNVNIEVLPRFERCVVAVFTLMNERS